MRKYIVINDVGAIYPESISGTDKWYFCKDSGINSCDLYEAENIYKEKQYYTGTACYLLHYPDGEVHKPFEKKENIYIEAPVYCEGLLYFLCVDFREGTIKIASYAPENRKLTEIARLLLTSVKDCYNLSLKTSPIFLTRHAWENTLEIIWPERRNIKIGDRETVGFRDGDDLFCSDWYENPDYHEHVIIRDWSTGQEKQRLTGSMRLMPDGSVWICSNNREAVTCFSIRKYQSMRTSVSSCTPNWRSTSSCT